MSAVKASEMSESYLPSIILYTYQISCLELLLFTLVWWGFIFSFHLVVKSARIPALDPVCRTFSTSIDLYLIYMFSFIFSLSPPPFAFAQVLVYFPCF